MLIITSTILHIFNNFFFFVIKSRIFYYRSFHRHEVANKILDALIYLTHNFFEPPVTTQCALLAIVVTDNVASLTTNTNQATNKRYSMHQINQSVIDNLKNSN